jgi:hypothetical protein
MLMGHESKVELDFIVYLIAKVFAVGLLALVVYLFSLRAKKKDRDERPPSGDTK